ncbi:MAG: mechanosensitive ion channel family protein [Bacteroidetes bacterium]|nr:mechanosensitive ion channel family protein [Bacteroidota bacterium]MCW5894177.1 mechanosensitive ion channel family protein [Bacteroidota bacterium]
MSLFQTNFLGNSLQDWLLAAGMAVVVYSVLTFMFKRVARRFSRFAATTETRIDNIVAEILGKTRWFFILGIALFAGGKYVTLPPAGESLLRNIVIFTTLIQTGLWATQLLASWIRESVERKMAEDAASATTMTAMSFLGRVLIWSVVLLLALDNMGVNITALVTGLGIGGVAVALAIQNILGDLFASLSIVLDKPFVIGDFIIVNEYLGTVEYIGLKTTRIRSLSGEQVIFSNSDLLKSRIRNFKRMQQRRVVFSIGITYQTPFEKLSRVAGMIRSIIEVQPLARFDRAHFKEYGDSSLVFEIVYHVGSADFNTYMDIQQHINLEIYRRFEDEGIDFAYPTRTVYLHNGSQDAVASPKEKTSGFRISKEN